MCVHVLAVDYMYVYLNIIMAVMILLAIFSRGGGAMIIMHDVRVLVIVFEFYRGFGSIYVICKFYFESHLGPLLCVCMYL